MSINNLKIQYIFKMIPFIEKANISNEWKFKVDIYDFSFLYYRYYKSYVEEIWFKHS